MRRLLLVVLGLVVVGAGVAAWLGAGLYQPYAGFREPVVVEIPRGSGVRAIGRRLQEAGVLRHDWELLAARTIRSSGTPQAGEYRFERPATALEVYDRLARGDVSFAELTVPEGSNLFDIAAKLERAQPSIAKEFLRLARTPALIRDLAPEAPSLEGYLFPASYRLTSKTTALSLCRDMTAQFRKAWREAGGSGRVHETVTMASLVEKESAVPAERPLIAAVYRNRLRLGMSMDCDPTVIYAALLEGRYRGTIYRSDLDNPHPYNTYRHPGLPPGPIANPGLGALKAALRPSETGYLYFVAKPDGSGGHRFSETLSAHNVAVQEYRRGQPSRP